MAGQTLKVGVIGGSVRRRWGGRVHVPVFQQLPETEVVAQLGGFSTRCHRQPRRIGSPTAATLRLKPKIADRIRDRRESERRTARSAISQWPSATSRIRGRGAG